MNKIKKAFFATLVGATLLGTVGTLPVFAASQSRDYTIPGGGGTITSNVWRQTIETISGNTIQWDYQVSAVYSGSRTVTSIRTAWTGSAQLRNSGSINIGTSSGGVSVGGGSSWQTASNSGSWTNTNGATTSSWRSNLVITPRVDYRANTVAITNAATVNISGDARPFTINAGV